MQMKDGTDNHLQKSFLTMFMVQLGKCLKNKNKFSLSLNNTFIFSLYKWARGKVGTQQNYPCYSLELVSNNRTGSPGKHSLR